VWWHDDDDDDAVYCSLLQAQRKAHFLAPSPRGRGDALTRPDTVARKPNMPMKKKAMPGAIFFILQPARAAQQRGR